MRIKKVIPPVHVIRWVLGLCALVQAMVSPAAAQLAATFDVKDRGAFTISSLGAGGSTVVGSARIQPNVGNTAPAGLAVLGLRQNGVLVSEVSVPGSALLLSGRVYAEMRAPVNTGLAIANPNDSMAMIDFFFTDQSGNDIGTSFTTIPPNGQIAAFLNQAPFGNLRNFQGAFTFRSNVPVGAVALRSFTNERGEFLMSTLPVIDVSVTSFAPSLIPDFADGAGWATEILLINPSDNLITGTVSFVDSQNRPVQIVLDGLGSSAFSYSIPKHSSKKFTSSGTSRALLTGSVNVAPTNGTATPGVQLVFALRMGGVTVTEGGIPVTPKGFAFRLYVESLGATGDPGNIQTAIAIANTNSVSTTVKLELFQLDGSSTGIEPIFVMLQPFEMTSKFLSEYFSSLVLPDPNADPFKGVVRISSNSEISVLGLLSRFNERNEFLFTATLQADESRPAPNGDGLIPQFADSGGYTTQFILLSGSSGQSSSGVMRFFSQLGQPIILPLKLKTSQP